jgi:D-cysteine desulfhydrase
VRALVARFPRLAALPHADLGVRETPLEEHVVDGATLLVKRDDLSAETMGGNKVRALELLLAGVGPGDVVLTVGARGSTHALAVARYAAQLGARTEVITWPQEAHAVAEATAARMGELSSVRETRSIAAAYLVAFLRRLRGRRWIPAGGSVPLGALGSVSAAMELASQLRLHPQLAPTEVVVPLGSGGTVAGLLVGFAIAGLPARVVGVQVVPRIVANAGHVLRLARRTRALVQRLTGEALPRLDAGRLVIDRSAYGGAYGRETAEGRAATTAFAAIGGPALEPTYSAKAFAVALRRARASPDERVLFWLTFDGRWM